MSHSPAYRNNQDPIFPVSLVARLRHVDIHSAPLTITPTMWAKGFASEWEPLYYAFLDWRFRGWVRIGLLILGLYQFLRLAIIQLTADTPFTAQLSLLLVGLYCAIAAIVTLCRLSLRTIYGGLLPLLLLVTWSIVEINLTPWQQPLPSINIAQLVTPYAIALVILRFPLRLGIPVCGVVTFFFLLVCSANGITITIPLLSLLAAALSATLLFGMVLEQEARTDFVQRLTIFQLVTQDPLTGLANRAHFMKELDAALEQNHSTKTSVALILLDIDHFKRVNDTYGHAIGDGVLRQVGAVLERFAHDGRAAGRLGGEEFAFLLPYTDKHKALHTAEAICAAVRTIPFHYGDCVFHITISAGLATTQTSPTLSRDHLYQRADRHLYAAKANGRDCVMSTHSTQAWDAA